MSATSSVPHPFETRFTTFTLFYSIYLKVFALQSQLNLFLCAFYLKKRRYISLSNIELEDMTKKLTCIIIWNRMPSHASLPHSYLYTLWNSHTRSDHLHHRPFHIHHSCDALWLSCFYAAMHTLSVKIA